jgi:hypothetical protein
MINYGNGFNWNDVYFMPIHLRNFYFKKLVEAKKEEKKSLDDAKRKSKVRR